MGLEPAPLHPPCNVEGAIITESISQMTHGVKWMTASNVVREVLSGAVTFILAALLMPREFGTVAMAYIFLTFIETLTGFGFNIALIQRKELEAIHLDSVFWFNLVAGVIITGIAILASGWWANVNRVPELQIIICVLAALILIRGLSFVQTAYIQKKMDFRSLAIRDNVATTLGGATGIVLALLGFGVWSLVWQHLIRELSGTILIWQLSNWRPRRSFSWAAISDLFGYAWKAFSGQIGVFAQNQMDGLLVGLLLGPAALGIYRLADRLIEMNLKFLPRAVQLVSLSHFATLQDDLPELNRSFLFGLHLNSIITFPAMAFLAGASPVILSAIGPQWLDATTVLRILTIIGISKALILLVGPLLQALFRPGIHSINTWTLAVANSLAVFGAVLVFPALTQVQLISMVAAMRTFVFVVIFTPLMLWQARCASGLSLKALLKSIQPAIFTSLIIVCSQAFLIHFEVWSYISNRYAILFACTTLAGLTWLACIRALDPVAWGRLAGVVRTARVRFGLLWV